MVAKTKSTWKYRVSEKLEDLIRVRRWAVVTVNGSPGYSYSVGLTDRDLPEMIVFGVGRDEGPKIIARAALAALDGAPLAINEPVEALVDGFRAVLRQLTPAEMAQYLKAGWVRSTGMMKAVQIVWPDPNGNFPWERGFDQQFAPYQPVLGMNPLLMYPGACAADGLPAALGEDPVSRRAGEGRGEGER